MRHFSRLLLCLRWFCWLPLGLCGQVTTIHTFDLLYNHGRFPTGSLETDGYHLFGMTQGSGALGCGVIFSLLKDGNGYTILHDFDPQQAFDGRGPVGGLTYRNQLWGMTAGGGWFDRGTIFKLDVNGGNYSVLHLFADSTGSQPLGNLLAEGLWMYGMTYLGGDSAAGVVFRIRPDGAGYEVLHHFDGVLGGGHPWGDLVSDGTSLFGMTQEGGANDMGIIFSIGLDGTNFVKYHDFAGSDGRAPVGSLLLNGGALYGMTMSGGSHDHGVVFKLQSDGAGFQLLHEFSYGDPFGSLTTNGVVLYGFTTNEGQYDKGSLFQMGLDGNGFQDFVDFNAPDGYHPVGRPLLDGSLLFGMAEYGGFDAQGTIFKVPVPPFVGLEGHETASQVAHPNPNNGAFSVTLPEGAQGLEVVDALGRQVLQIDAPATHLQIDLRQLPNGLYWLRFWDGSMMRAERVCVGR